jgi:putative phosphoribosyl transferase
MTHFADRRHAGQALAARLEHYRHHPDVVVLGLPRGGVPVAWEVALALSTPLDVFIVRKLGFPGQEEYAMGAIASGGVRVLNPDVERLRIPKAQIEAVAAREQEELERRERLYRRGRKPLPLTGRIVIIVDDGLATGSSMRAAVAAVKRHEPRRIVVAVPVAAPEACEDFRAEVDEVVCVQTPDPFRAVGLWYESFDQTRDEEVSELLEAAARGPRPPHLV